MTQPEGNAILVRAANHHAVDDHLDRVALVLVEALDLVEVELLAIHAHADEALLADLFEDAVALGLAVLDHGPEQQPRAVWQREDPLDDLLHRHARDLVAVGAVRMADPRE